MELEDWLQKGYVVVVTMWGEGYRATVEMPTVHGILFLSFGATVDEAIEELHKVVKQW